VVKPRLYHTRVAHGRTERVQHGFAYRHATWLVDLDDVPVLPAAARVARFDARDHLGDPTPRCANVDAYRTEGSTSTGAQSSCSRPAPVRPRSTR
jgi:DUF1365 family protein